MNDVKLIYSLLSFIGVTILRRDISPVGFKKSNHQGNVVCKLPQFLIFEKYPIYIGKRQLRLIFIIWHTGKKWYWLQHTSILPRTYCITLHIWLLFGEIISCIVSFFLQVVNESNPKPNPNHNRNPIPNPNS